MNAEIRRIARRMCVSRRTGIPWTLVIALLFALAGAAYGQPPLPAPGQIGSAPDPTATYVQYHRPEHDWAALQMQKPPRVQRVAMVPRQRELQSELDRLHDEMAAVERRLAELDQAKRRRRVWVEPPRPRGPEPDPRIDELNRRREELAERARQMEMELEELHQHLENRGRDIDNELRGIQEEMEELMRRRDELAERAHQREMELEELRANTERRQDELSMELREIHEQMRGIEEELARIERERQERRRRLLDEVRGQTQELREQLRMLEERAERMQRALDELGDDDAEAEELRRALAETREQIRLIERQLGERRGPLPRPPRRWPTAPPPELDDACEELTEQIEAAKLELEALREAAQEIDAQLERLHSQDHPSTVGSVGQCWYWH
ncbi:MAG: hypothetical protein JSW27_14265 [Phycisphaerales bacterium]|nr:MAG: hypothetical protein JSW27_14265 [Phycisphaerales bacterium]